MKRTVKKPQERRAEIIAAARGLFLEKSYEKATMEDLMQLLGVAKGTLYHYFKSKEELLEAAVEDIVDEYLQAMEALMQKSSGTALQKMEALIRAGSEAAAPALLEKLHKKGNEALHTRLLAVIVMKLAPIYAQLIEQGCEEGIFQTQAPLESAEFILSAAQFLTDQGIFPWKEEELLRRKRAFPHLIEQLLQAKPASFSFY